MRVEINNCAASPCCSGRHVNYRSLESTHLRTGKISSISHFSTEYLVFRSLISDGLVEFTPTRFSRTVISHTYKHRASKSHGNHTRFFELSDTKKVHYNLILSFLFYQTVWNITQQNLSIIFLQIFEPLPFQIL